MTLPDVILVVCVLAVAAGAGLIYAPAGLIAGGLLGGACVLAWARGTAQGPGA